MRKMGEEVLRAQIPVLSWWAVTTVITRTSTTLTMLSILVLGVWFYLHNLTTVGEIVMFMSFPPLLISRLEQAVHFANEMVMDAPRIAEFFEVLDTEPAVRDRPDAMNPDRLHGLVELKDVSFASPRLRSAIGDRADRRHGRSRPQARGPAAQHRRRFPGGPAVQPFDRRE